jgi:hypothetical protein
MEKQNDLAEKVYASRPFLPVEAQFFVDARAREKELKRIEEARSRAGKDRAKNAKEYEVVSEKIGKRSNEIIDIDAKLGAVNLALQDALAESADTKPLDGEVLNLSRDISTLRNAKIGFERRLKALAEIDKKLADEFGDLDNVEKQIVTIGLACEVNAAFSAVSKTLWELNGTIFNENPYLKEGSKLWDSVFLRLGFSFEFCQSLPRILFKSGSPEEIEALKKNARSFDGFFYHFERDHVAGIDQIPRPDRTIQSPFLHS